MCIFSVSFCLCTGGTIPNAITSGRRRGEIHALQHGLQRKEDWSEITLFPDLRFIPKTKLAGDGAKAFAPLTLKALPLDLGTDSDKDRSGH